MIVPIHEPVWWGSLIWLGGVTAVAFVVAWLSGTRLHLRRVVYIPTLFLTTGALTVGYLLWLGADIADVATRHWGWGLLAAFIAGALLAKPISRQPVTRHVGRQQLPWELFWEDGVYGSAEGVLLSALPPFIAWQMVHELGWQGVGGALARWALPVLAAAIVVVIHHLGYWNFRNIILLPVTLGLTVLTVAFLVTGSWIAPALGHILMHAQLTRHGTEMPPRERPSATRAGAPRVPRLAATG